MNASLFTDFAMSYPPFVFTELNMMLVRLSGATSLRDTKCSDLLAQWMSLSPLIRARLTEAMDHAPLPAVHKAKVQAIHTYAEALFRAPYLIGLLLELGAPRSGFRVLSEYITCRGDAYTTRTGLPFPRAIPAGDQFDATWKSLTATLALDPPAECAPEQSPLPPRNPNPLPWPPANPRKARRPPQRSASPSNRAAARRRTRRSPVPMGRGTESRRSKSDARSPPLCRRMSHLTPCFVSRCMCPTTDGVYPGVVTSVVAGAGGRVWVEHPGGKRRCFGLRGICCMPLMLQQ